MTEIQKRNSLVKIILLRVIIIVILINCILTVINIRETTKIQREKEDIRRENIKKEIENILDSWNSSIKPLEELFFKLQENAVQKISELNKIYDLKTANLSKEQELLGLDPQYFDFYIIENGIVVNTTFQKDLGLDFYAIKKEFKDYLLKILEDGNFVAERFALESSTRRLKLYSYLPTDDKKYIISIGCYSETADELMQIFMNRIRKIVETNEDILSVNFWLGTTQFRYSFVKDTFMYDLQDSIVHSISEEKPILTTNFQDEDRSFNGDFSLVKLNSKSDYFDDVVLSIITDITDKGKPISKIIIKQTIITLISLAILIVILILATKNIKRVIEDLLRKTTIIAKGALNERVNISGNNEMTTLAEQFNSMVEKLENSQKQLQDKNIEIEEKNKDLTDRNEEIIAQNDEILAQRDLLENQMEQISEQNKSITDSIKYASRIQQAMLPSEELIKFFFPKYFILFKPRDIVSGDFYWIGHIKNHTIIVVADCTGHGVPGSIMSMLGTSLLNEITSKIEKLLANEILNEVRDQLITSLRQTGQTEEAKDGMDIALCIISANKKKLQFAGANNPLYIVRDSELIEIKGDKMPVGIDIKAGKSFTNHEFSLSKGDSLYMFTDGYPDQFGGPESKKFGYRQFKELILNNQDRIMFDQQQVLDKTFEEWKKDEDQIDDVLVMGIKI